MTPIRRLWPLLLLLLLAGGLAACGDDDDDEASDAAATVEMVDYGYEVSGPVTAGGSIRLVNSGDELHMLAIGKLKEGATLEELQAALEEADPEAEEDPTLEFIESEEIGWPGGFVTPGNEVTFSASNLDPGDYALLCFVPTEGEGTPHFSKGMLGQMEIVEGDAAEEPEPDATYTVTAGEPLEGPDTLEAGRHTIEITGADPGDFEPQLIKAESPDQTPEEISELIDERFGAYESEEGPAKGAGKELGLIQFAGFDFGTLDSVTFTYDFKPGVYYLAAPDTDEDDSSAPIELIKITVD